MKKIITLLIIFSAVGLAFPLEAAADCNNIMCLTGTAKSTGDSLNLSLRRQMKDTYNPAVTIAVKATNRSNKSFVVTCSSNAMWWIKWKPMLGTETSPNVWSYSNELFEFSQDRLWSMKFRLNPGQSSTQTRELIYSPRLGSRNADSSYYSDPPTIYGTWKELFNDIKNGIYGPEASISADTVKSDIYNYQVECNGHFLSSPDTMMSEEYIEFDIPLDMVDT